MWDFKKFLGIDQKSVKSTPKPASTAQYSYKQRADKGFDFYKGNQKTNIEDYVQGTGANQSNLRTIMAQRGDIASQPIVQRQNAYKPNLYGQNITAPLNYNQPRQPIVQRQPIVAQQDQGWTPIKNIIDFGKDFVSGAQQSAGNVADIAVMGGGVIADIGAGIQGKSDLERAQINAGYEDLRNKIKGTKTITGQSFNPREDFRWTGNTGQDIANLAGRGLETGLNATMLVNPTRLAMAKGATNVVPKVLAKDIAKEMALFGGGTGLTTGARTYAETGDVGKSIQEGAKSAVTTALLQGALSGAGYGIGKVKQPIKTAVNQATSGYSPGFISVGRTPKNIHVDDKAIMSDFIDYARGTYKPDKNLAFNLEKDASTIAERYGIKMPPTLKGLANEFDKRLVLEAQKPSKGFSRGSVTAGMFDPTGKLGKEVPKVEPEIARVADNIQKNNKNINLSRVDAEAMAKDVIANREFNSTPQVSKPELPIIGKPLTNKEKVLSSKPVEYLFGDKKVVQDSINTKDYIKQQTKLQENARNLDKPNILQKTRQEISNKMIDSLSPIENTMRQAVKNGSNIPLERNITPQLDRALRADTIAGQYIKDRGLATVIQNVPDTKALDQYLIAKHAVDLEKNGVKTGRNLVADKQLVDSLSPVYEQHAQDVMKYNRELLDKAVEYGLVSKDTAKLLKEKYPNYVPANRIFSEDELTGFKGVGGGKVSISTQSVVQKIKGSTREIESPLSSIVNKTNDVISQGERNKAASILASYKSLPDNPFNLRELGKNETIGSKSTISFLDKGVKRTFETTPEIAAAAKSLNKEQIGILGRIVRIPTRILRLGATGINPAFALANITKDLIGAAINSKHPLRSSIFNPSVLKQATASALYHKGKSYGELVREGAGGTSFDIARDAPVANLKSIRAEKNIGTKALYNVTNPAELIRATENTIGRSEEFSRALQYFGNKQAALAKGMSEKQATIFAADAARTNTVNFARHGDYGAVLNSALPYLNAGIQGSRMTLRTLRDRPIQTISKIAVLSTIPVLTTTAWNIADPQRKEAYDDISDYEKDNNIIIVPPNPEKDPSTGKWNVIKIPITQSVAGINNIARNGLETLSTDKEFDVIKALGELIGTATSINASSPRSLANQITPQILKPGIETLTNQNLFTGNKIIPDSQVNLPASEQYGEFTSGTAKQIGKIFNVSPRIVDNAIKTSTGGAGQNAVNASDQLLASAGVIKPEEVQGKGLLESVTGRFYGASAIPTSQKIEEKFKKSRDELTNSNEYKSLSKDEQRKAVNRLQTDIKAIEYSINDKLNPNSGYTPTKLTANQIALDNGSRKITDYTTTNANADPISTYQSHLEAYNQKVKDGTITGPDKITQEKSLAKEAITSQYGTEVLDFYKLSNADKQAYFKQDPETAQRLYDLAKEMDNKLVGSGLATTKVSSTSKSLSKGSSAKKSKYDYTKRLETTKYSSTALRDMLKSIKIQRGKI